MVTQRLSLLLVTLALLGGFLAGAISASRLGLTRMSSYERGYLMSLCYQAREIAFISPCLGRITDLP